MDKSSFAKLVFLVLLVMACVVAMIMMAIERGSGQEVVPAFVILQVITWIIPLETRTYPTILFSKKTRDRRVK